MSYNRADFLRHVHEQRDTPITSFIRGQYEGADNNVPTAYWRFVDGLLNEGLIEGSSSGGMGSSRPGRVRLTGAGLAALRR